MSPERWEKLKGELKDKFSDIKEENGELDFGPGDFERLSFTGPMGKIRLDFITRPAVIDKKTTTSRRVGAGVAVDYVYSQDDFIHKLQVYKWNDATSDWDEIKASMFGE
ncbi:MAG: hypothetical protein WC310_01030 [Patescibacteria group bacterium]|jgi:hypothetical protein